ncbi:hypothetical protein GOP47_0018506 [Adiantum capillus-veneris]|uniref:Uncharacterized protein n=1 Tax=Adiantum capillus-veneris TaxID=13818 RepID=A0A9D4UDT2_ADICA|nr:hypothetical protein GOP47_0018506 [Adiantum capillus-veneris]
MEGDKSPSGGKYGCNWSASAGLMAIIDCKARAEAVTDGWVATACCCTTTRQGRGVDGRLKG